MVFDVFVSMLAMVWGSFALIAFCPMRAARRRAMERDVFDD